MVDLATKMLLAEKLRFAITIAGVAFAVSLVLIQVGLFFGLLDNANITIEHTNADLWVTSRSTPNVDFGHAFPERRVHRVRAIPGVERADNLIVAFMTIALPSGAEESTIVYALADFSKWGLPWNVDEGDVADMKRGSYFMMDESAARRFGSFVVGEKREVFGRRLSIIGKTRDAKSFTTTPISFVDYATAQSLSPMLKESTTYILVKVAPGEYWGWAGGAVALAINWKLDRATAAGIAAGEDVPADSRIPLSADLFSLQRLMAKGR